MSTECIKGACPRWNPCVAECQQRAKSAPAVAPREPLPEGLTPSEKKIRRLLCARVGGALAYMDDGEAHDATASPHIDFMKDSADEIERKLMERGRATLSASAPPQPVQAPVGERDFFLGLAQQLDEADPELVAKLAMVDATGSTNEKPRLGMQGAIEVLGILSDIFEQTADSIFAAAPGAAEHPAPAPQAPKELIDIVESILSDGVMDPVHSADRWHYNKSWHSEPPPDGEQPEDFMLLQGRRSCAARIVEALAAPQAPEVGVEPSVLPQSLINQIGEYGLARTDKVTEIERIHLWQLLIDGIKEYAKDYTAEQLSSLRESHEMLEWLEKRGGVLILASSEPAWFGPQGEALGIETPLRAAIRSAMAAKGDGNG
jgi:hypothetical protein